MNHWKYAVFGIMLGLLILLATFTYVELTAALHASLK